MSGERPTVARRIPVEWLWLLGVGGLFMAVGGHLVATEAGVGAGRRWLLVAGVVVAGELGFLGYHLGRTSDGAGERRFGLGVANAVTVGRGLLYAATAGFLLLAPSTPAIRWAPGLCYGAGAALDFVDGRLARRTDTETELGGRLDHAVDTLGFLVAPLVGVLWGRLPIVYLSLSAARYLFRGGLWWRRSTGRPVAPLPESPWRRRLAAMQMAVIAVALPPVLPADLVHPAATIALVPSLVVFGRDWLVVSNRLPGREE